MVYCDICGCTDIKYFGKRKGELYCRRCISFKGERVIKNNSSIEQEVKPMLKYKLTKDQLRVSNGVTYAIKNNKNVLIYAVCGAGKTEIVYDVISYMINKNKTVGFAIPRKDVVIELEDRIKDAFPNLKIVSVYGGHTKELNGDIILLTTHQLYRYEKFFDLLIIDETDAFPFSNNEVLMNMFKRSIKGNYVMMSATPLPWMKEKIKKEGGEIISLYKRFHGKKIIVPTIKIIPFLLELETIRLLTKYKKENKPCLIFVPTREDAETLFHKLRLVFKDIQFVHSLKDDRHEIISSFKKGKFLFLITTSVLERGITIKNVQVIVVNASHEIYNAETLIQISGRVGRKIDATDGEVVFLAKKPTFSIKDCIRKIEEANDYGEL